MISGNTCSSLFMDSCVSSLVVLSFTDSCFIPLSLIPKDTSKINLKGKLLCVIAATGEIFNCGGNLLLMSFYFITVANPNCTLSAVSSRRLATDFFCGDVGNPFWSCSGFC